MITLHPLARSDIGRVAHLVLPPQQESFVGAIGDMTGDPDPQISFHYAALDDLAVGFFKLDRDFQRIVKRLPAGTLGFRGLLIGGQYQGSGYGAALLQALPAYVRHAHPDETAIWLSVDEANDHAIRCYQRAGWTISGPSRHGRCGPEHVMVLQLKNA